MVKIVDDGLEVAMEMEMGKNKEVQKNIFQIVPFKNRFKKEEKIYKINNIMPYEDKQNFIRLV